MTRRLMKEFETLDGYKVYRLSRWIRIQCLDVTERHPLWYYADEDTQVGKRRTVDGFRWNGRWYALGQFMRFGSGFCPTPPPMFYDETGKLNYLGGYDSEEYFEPIMIEIDECGENVRVYKEGRK